MLALQASLALLVLGVGLHARPYDLTFLVRNPGLLARSILSVNVIMPLLALLAVVALSLTPAVELALVALAASPIPPFLPLTAKRAGGKESYTVALLATESLLAIALVPGTMWFLGSLVFRSLYVSPGRIAMLMSTGILLPIVVGTLTNHFWPRLAQRLTKPVGIVALVLLAAAFIPLVIAAWRPMMSLVGNGTLVAIIVMALVGLALGHWLGGSVPQHQTVLALATATRHPAVAMTILASTAPDEKLAPAAVVLALIVTALTALPYSNWAKAHTDVGTKPILITPSRTSGGHRRSAVQRTSSAVPARRRGDRRT